MARKNLKLGLTPWMSRVGKVRPAGSIELRVSPSPSKIPDLRDITPPLSQSLDPPFERGGSMGLRVFNG
jgi:hypothetical protein